MYTAFFAEEAEEQLKSLDKSSRNKILKAVRVFEAEGTNAKNSRSLIDGLFEIKADNVRAYFKYFGDKIIIIGLIVLKKSQKAPKRFIEQAIRNINNRHLEISMLNNSSKLRKPLAMEEFYQHSWLLPIFFALGRPSLLKEWVLSPNVCINKAELELIKE